MASPLFLFVFVFVVFAILAVIGTCGGIKAAALFFQALTLFLLAALRLLGIALGLLGILCFALALLLGLEEDQCFRGGKGGRRMARV